MHTNEGLLTIQQLHDATAAREIDTVIVAFTDMQGRLMGKRLSARFFLESAATHGAESCNYLLTVDVELNTVPGYALTSWESGYGDMTLMPDLATLRRIPWLPGTALVIADLLTVEGHSPIHESPREILKRQIERLADLGFTPLVATELEFIAFDDDYRDAWARGYRGLTPATDYNADYGLLPATRMEPLLHAIRTGMEGAGMYCEGVKGECNFGQQEITFRYDHALVTCDNHSIYKHGAKEIAASQGKSVTFMAKYNQREGSSCHIHLSFEDRSGAPVFADDSDPAGFSHVFRSFLAGQLVALREFTLLYAPNINSYKRFAEGSFAPTAVAWGYDNRTCAFRVLGRGHGLRFENRLPGGDANQYLAVAGMLAAGIAGIEQNLSLGEAISGNAYSSSAERVPMTLRDSAELFEQSALARGAFGDRVVDHYVHAARVEVQAFDSAVTDWERIRGFERL